MHNFHFAAVAAEILKSICSYEATEIESTKT